MEFSFGDLVEILNVSLVCVQRHRVIASLVLSLLCLEATDLLLRCMPRSWAAAASQVLLGEVKETRYLLVFLFGLAGKHCQLFVRFLPPISVLPTPPPTPPSLSPRSLLPCPSLLSGPSPRTVPPFTSSGSLIPFPPPSHPQYPIFLIPWASPFPFLS